MRSDRTYEQLMDDAIASGAAGRHWLAVTEAEAEIAQPCPCPRTGGAHWHIMPGEYHQAGDEMLTLALEVEPPEQVV